VEAPRWTLERFGYTPAKLVARLRNRTEPRIVVVSVPKAGTHLLERALCLHPRLYRTRLPTIMNRDWWNGLDALLRRLGPGQILLTHLRYREEHPSVIRDGGAKCVFLVRDPRDIVVSNAFYSARHPANDAFRHLPEVRDRIRLVITGDADAGVMSIAERLDHFSGWLDAGFPVVRFEDLVGGRGGGDDATQRAALTELFTYLDVAREPAMLDRIAAGLFSWSSPTFRRGAIGAWRDHFDDELLALFAGVMQDRLQRYGYAEGPAPATAPGSQP